MLETKNAKERTLYEIYNFGLLLKGINAIVEILTGFLVFFISHDYVVNLVASFTNEELTQDKSDFIANYLYHAAQNFSLGARIFSTIYLLTHGIVKLVLVIGLLKNKKWAYPATIVFLGIFIFYELYKFIFAHSLWMLGFAVFDSLILWLVWHEYARVKAGVKMPEATLKL